MKRILMWSLIVGAVGLLASGNIADQFVHMEDYPTFRQWDVEWMRIRTIVLMVALAVGAVVGYWRKRGSDPDWRLLAAWTFGEKQ